MHHRLLLAALAAGTLFGNACEGSSTTKTSTTSGTAPVTVGATLAKSEAAEGAPAMAPKQQMVEFGKDVTLTSVKVVVGNIALRLKGGDDSGARNDDDRYDDDVTKASRRAEGRAEDDGHADDESGDNHGGSDFALAGPYMFDLTAQTVTPAMQAVSMPTGTYKHVELTFQAATTADATAMGLDATDPVIGNSYVIEGLLNNVEAPGVPTGSSVKLVIFGSQEKTYKVNLKQGVPVTSGGTNNLLLVFDADGWFPSSLLGQLRSGLNEGSVTVDKSGTQPVVYLDANRNSAIAAQFNKLFHDGVLLVKDKNGDGEVSSGETPEQVGGQ